VTVERKALNASELRAVNDLLVWDRTRRKADLFAAYFALALGAFVVVAVTHYTLSHLQDPRAYMVTRIGFFAALVFFLVFAFVSHRVRDRHRLATIVRKLGGARTVL
jgi:hypothetical protein